jgi:hypothetical protein
MTRSQALDVETLPDLLFLLRKDMVAASIKHDSVPLTAIEMLHFTHPGRILPDRFML